jgi:hypothetical protein
MTNSKMRVFVLSPTCYVPVVTVWTIAMMMAVIVVPVVQGFVLSGAATATR